MVSIFISYSSADIKYARKLFHEFNRIGVKAWLDEREIKVGDDIISGIERGLRESDYLAIILTPNSISSRWVKEELNSFRIQQINEGNTKVLPLLYEECELPPLLKSKKWADFRYNFDEGFRELLYTLGIKDYSSELEIKPLSSNWRKNISIIWDENGKYRKLSWNEIKKEAEKIRGGISILTEDLLEMLEYKAAPFREHTKVLRKAFSEIISQADLPDADFIAKIIISSWRDYSDNIGASWMLFLMKRELSVKTLNRAYSINPEITKWIFSTLYMFTPDIDDDPIVFEADLIKQHGQLPPELQEITKENWNYKISNKFIKNS